MVMLFLKFMGSNQRVLRDRSVPDVEKDRKILRSEVCVDRKFFNPLRIVCSDVDIDLTMSHR